VLATRGDRAFVIPRVRSRPEYSNAWAAANTGFRLGSVSAGLRDIFRPAGRGRPTGDNIFGAAPADLTQGRSDDLEADAPDRVADKVAGARYLCVSCHVVRSDAAPLVQNLFQP
jgi:hypothetical protein